jgi:hypothetical protein
MMDVKQRTRQYMSTRAKSSEPPPDITEINRILGRSLIDAEREASKNHGKGENRTKTGNFSGANSEESEEAP